MAQLEFVDIHKSYGDVSVLRDINIEVDAGEFIIVVGPSGCGKSSLLRMVAGLESVTRGDISIAKTRVNTLEPKDRDIAMVFQNYALYPHKTVYENIAYGLKMRKYAKSAIEQRVSDAANILKISPLLERKPHELSGGQRQRVAMGRAIVRQPAVFLFDEPLSNLDAKLRMEMRLEIKTLQRRLGVTSLYVTHDQTEAMTMADRIVILNHGGIEQIDTPMAVYQRPHSIFVAEFMGSSPINLLEGRISSDGKQVHCDCGLDITLGSAQIRVGEGGRDIILGIRPEHIALAEEGQGQCRLTVKMVEAMGADTLVHGILGDDRHRLVVRLQGHHSIRCDDVLALKLIPASLSLFSQQSGLRLEDK